MTDENTPKLDAENQSGDGTIHADKPFHVHNIDVRSGACECGVTFKDLLGELSNGTSPVGGTGDTNAVDVDRLIASSAYGIPNVYTSPPVDTDQISADAYQRGYRDSTTPNVVIENAKARKVINTVLACAGLLLACVTAADISSADFDLSRITEPAWAVYGILQGGFGIAVVNSNIPKAR